MEYDRYFVQAFERESGKWRARIRRADGKPVRVVGLQKVREFVTGADAKSAATALMMAMSTIDAGYFSRGRMKEAEGLRRGRRSGSAAAALRAKRSTSRRRARAHAARPARKTS